MSLRAYDHEGMMVDTDVIKGDRVESLIARLFSAAQVRMIHARFARRGCYACCIGRA